MQEVKEFKYLYQGLKSLIRKGYEIQHFAKDGDMWVVLCAKLPTGQF